MNDYLYNRRKQLGYTLEEVGNKVGVGKSTVRKWERGMIENMGRDKIVALSKALKISPLDILDIDKDELPSNILSIYNQLDPPRQEYVYEIAEEQLEEQNRTAALYGGVAANPTELAYGDPVYDEEVTKDVPASADGALTIHGDSMEDMFYDGDICFFKRQPDVENGEIAIVEIEGTGVTCKKVIKENGNIILRSLNKKYEDRKIEKESIRVIGKVVK